MFLNHHIRPSFIEICGFEYYIRLINVGDQKPSRNLNCEYILNELINHWIFIVSTYYVQCALLLSLVFISGVSVWCQICVSGNQLLLRFALRISRSWFSATWGDLHRHEIVKAVSSMRCTSSENQNSAHKKFKSILIGYLVPSSMGL